MKAGSSSLIYIIIIFKTHHLHLLTTILILSLISCSPIPVFQSPKVRYDENRKYELSTYMSRQNFHELYEKRSGTDSLPYIGYNRSGKLYDTSRYYIGLEGFNILPFLSIAPFKRHEFQFSAFIFPVELYLGHKFSLLESEYHKPFHNLNAAILTTGSALSTVGNTGSVNATTGLLLSTDIHERLELITAIHYSYTRSYHGDVGASTVLASDDSIDETEDSFKVIYSLLNIQCGFRYEWREFSATLGGTLPFILKVGSEATTSSRLSSDGLIENPRFYRIVPEPSVHFLWSVDFYRY